VARMGKFSSDPTISDYAREIWRVKPVPVHPTLKRSLEQVTVHA